MRRRASRVTVSHPAAARAESPEVVLLRELVAIDELLAGKEHRADGLAADPATVEWLAVAGRDGDPGRALQTRLAERRLRREQITACIGPALLELYERAVQSSARRPVVSLLGGRACGGCFLCIEPRLAVGLYDFGYVACPHCARLNVAAKPKATSQQ